MSDLIDRLRRAKTMTLGVGSLWRLCDEAADCIEAAKAERDAVLEEAAEAAWPREGSGYVRHTPDGPARDSYGVVLPGSPYDSGRYEAAKRIRAMKEDEA